MNHVRLGSGRLASYWNAFCLNHGFIFRSSTALFIQEILTVTTSRTSCVNEPTEREHSPGVTEAVNKDLKIYSHRWIANANFVAFCDNKTYTQPARIHVSCILSLLLWFLHPSLPLQFNLVISSFFAWVMLPKVLRSYVLSWHSESIWSWILPFILLIFLPSLLLSFIHSIRHPDDSFIPSFPSSFKAPGRFIHSILPFVLPGTLTIHSFHPSLCPSRHPDDSFIPSVLPSFQAPWRLTLSRMTLRFVSGRTFILSSVISTACLVATSCVTSEKQVRACGCVCACLMYAGTGPRPSRGWGIRFCKKFQNTITSNCLRWEGTCPWRPLYVSMVCMGVRMFMCAFCAQRRLPVKTLICMYWNWHVSHFHNQITLFSEAVFRDKIPIKPSSHCSVPQAM